MDTSLIKCPSCGAYASLEHFQKQKDINNHDIDLTICRTCFAIVNTNAIVDFAESKNKFEQASSSEEFYSVDKSVIKSIEFRRKAAADVIRFALKNLPQGFQSGRFADFGAGMGFMAEAAGQFFDESHAIEFNTATIKQLLPHFKNANKIRIHENLSEAPNGIDLLLSWHTFEHIIDVQQVLAEIVEKLAPNGAIIFQCPMFSPKHIVHTHYFLPNEHSCRVMCERAGLFNTIIWHDRDNEFITCLTHKNPPHKANEHEPIP